VGCGWNCVADDVCGVKQMIGYMYMLLAGLPAFASPVQGQNPSASAAIEIPRVDEPPRLEWFVGGLNGATHRLGTPVTDFRQREPGDGTSVSQSTTAFLSYDDGHLYAVFVCKDVPAAIRANVARREDIGADDAVALYLDTFHDRQRAYLFMVSPLGVQLDGIVTEGQSWDYIFDAVWKSEGRLTADGYVVRLAIPFRSLRFRRGGDQTWGIALSRVIRRNNEEAYWPQLTKRVQGFVPQFGTLQGLRNISPSRNVEVLPYGVLARARVLDEDAAALRSDREARLGIDAKLVVRDAVTLDATSNPDFSQVESDDPQVTVNERFEVFFPEKRPFFIENAGFFQTPINLFFSRRIVDPGLGARVTGKLGRWALGAIAIDDRAPGRRPSGDPLADRHSGIGALRLQREIRKDSTLGLLVTDREFGGSFARAFAFDTRWTLNRTWVASAQLARSDTRALDGRRRTGSGTFATIKRNGRQVEYMGRYVGFTPEFDAPLGFVHRVGSHQVDQEWQVTLRSNQRPIVNFGPTVAALFNWDRSGRLQDRDLTGSFRVELIGETEIQATRAEAFERFAGLSFRPHATELAIDTKWLKWLAVKATYAWGTAVNHDPAPDLAPFLARATEADISFSVRPTPRLRLQQTYLVSGLDTGAARVFTERRLRTKLTYQFTRVLSIRTIVDYKAVVPNATLTDEDYERKWSGDILLTYLVSPGTAVYVGYIDQYQNVGIVATNPPGLWRTEAPAMSVGRQVFAKVSYLWRF
jgi:hypothetical protein